MNCVNFNTTSIHLLTKAIYKRKSPSTQRGMVAAITPCKNNRFCLNIKPIARAVRIKLRFSVTTVWAVHRFLLSLHINNYSSPTRLDLKHDGL